MYFSTVKIRLALFVFFLALAAPGAETTAPFGCKLTYWGPWTSSGTYKAEKDNRRADLSATTRGSRYWRYAVSESNFAIVASQKEGNPGFRAWIADTSAAKRVLNMVSLEKWDGSKVTLIARVPSTHTIDGKDVVQVNLTCGK